MNPFTFFIKISPEICLDINGESTPLVSINTDTLAFEGDKGTLSDFIPDKQKWEGLRKLFILSDEGSEPIPLIKWIENKPLVVTVVTGAETDGQLRTVAQLELDR